MWAALSQSSTDTMVALQKKQSLLFIRCWLMQALQEGKGMGAALCVFIASPSPRGPLTCRTYDHKAGTLQRWGVRSRWGRGPPHWWATGGRVERGWGWVPRPALLRTDALMSWPVLEPHSPGRQLLPGQMQQSGVPAFAPPGPAPQH